MMVKAQLLHQFNAILRLHFALIGIAEIRPVSYQVTNYIFFCMVFDFLLPPSDILKRLRVCDVVY